MDSYVDMKVKKKHKQKQSNAIESRVELEKKNKYQS